MSSAQALLLNIDCAADVMIGAALGICWFPFFFELPVMTVASRLNYQLLCSVCLLWLREHMLL